jgi:hypothetical protein
MKDLCKMGNLGHDDDDNGKSPVTQSIAMRILKYARFPNWVLNKENNKL